MDFLLLLVSMIFGLIVIFLSVILDFKKRKLAKKLHSLLSEEEKKLLNAPWWKMKAFEQDKFLANAYERFKEEASSLIRFRNIFWARNFSIFIVISLYIFVEILDFLAKK